MSAYHDKNLGKRKKIGPAFDFSGNPGVKSSPSIAEGAGLILGWGAKIHVPWRQKTKT